jgi:hypothetical protein
VEKTKRIQTGTEQDAKKERKRIKGKNIEKGELKEEREFKFALSPLCKENENQYRSAGGLARRRPR